MAIIDFGVGFSVYHLNLKQVQPQTEPASLNGVRFPVASEDCPLETIEKLFVAQTIEHYAGHISEAARLLGVRRGALRQRMDKLGLMLQPRRIRPRPAPSCFLGCSARLTTVVSNTCSQPPLMPT